MLLKQNQLVLRKKHLVAIVVAVLLAFQCALFFTESQVLTPNTDSQVLTPNTESQVLTPNTDSQVLTPNVPHETTAIQTKVSDLPVDVQTDDFTTEVAHTPAPIHVLTSDNPDAFCQHALANPRDDASVIDRYKPSFWAEEPGFKMACLVMTSPSRCHNVTMRLERLGLPCTIVPGIRTTMEDVKAYGKLPDVFNKKPVVLGVGMAHLRLLKLFLEHSQQATHAIFLEDDAEFTSSTAVNQVINYTRALDELDTSWDVWYPFYSFERRPHIPEDQVAPGLPLYKSYMPRGLVAYVMSTQGAKKVLNNVRRIVLPIDEHFAKMIKLNAMKAFIAIPQLVEHVKAMSTIDNFVKSRIRIFATEILSCCCTDPVSLNSCVVNHRCRWHEHPGETCMSYREPDFGLQTCENACKGKHISWSSAPLQLTRYSSCPDASGVADTLYTKRAVPVTSKMFVPEFRNCHWRAAKGCV